MLKVNIQTGELLEDVRKPAGYIELRNGLTVRIYGKMPLLYKDRPFSDVVFKDEHMEELDDLVPYAVGQSFFVLMDGLSVKEMAADYYCHSRVYYTEMGGIIYISDDWRELPHTCMELDLFQLMYFMNWDETLLGETYYKDLKYFCPTYKYPQNSGFVRRFMRFRSLDSHGFHDAVFRTVKAVSQLDKKVGIMLSGGMDSTEVAVCAEEMNYHPVYYCAKIDDLEMFDNIQDCIGAKVIADHYGLDFRFAPCCIRSFLDGWNGELSKYVGFSYKDGKFWEAVSKKAKEDGMELLINGNNADYMHNFGYTMEDKASEKSYTHEFFTTMRKVTSNKQLDRVFVNHEYSKELIDQWNRFNDGEFTQERFLAWCMTNGNMYAGYRGLAVDEACNEYGQDLYDKQLDDCMRDLISEFRDGNVSNTRQLVLNGFLVGEMNGANARAIMGAASANDVECLIIHTSPLIFDACIKMVFDDRDVVIPKRESYEALKDNEAYLLAVREKNKVDPQGLCTPSDVWRVILDVLDKEFNVKECTDAGYELLDHTGLFDMVKLGKLAKSDIGIAVRVAWLGYIDTIYAKSLA